MNHTNIKHDFGEEGFAEHYNARIRPRLAEFEAMRRKWLLLWRATLVLVGALAVGVVVYLCVELLSISKGVFHFFFIVPFLFFVGMLCVVVLIMFPEGLKKGFIPAIYDFLKGEKLQYYSTLENLKALTPKKLLALFLIGAYVVAVLVFMSHVVAKLFFLLLLLFVCFSAPPGVALIYRRKLKEALTPIIFDFFKDNKLQYHTSQGKQIGGSGGISIRGTREVAGKLYSYTKLIVDDGFTGTHLGYDFLIDEVVITQTSGAGEDRRTETLFRGLVLGIAGNCLFADEVLLRGRGQTPIGRKFRRVHLEDVRFEEMFDAFGTDQIATRRLLEPRKMELIMAAVGRISSSDTPEFMFLEDGFFLFAPSDKNHFEPGGITTSVYETDTIKEVLTDIRVVLSLIEILQEEKILPEKVHD